LAAKAGQFELNVMEPVMVFNIIQSLQILTRVITVFREKCISGITANSARCREMVDGSVGIITPLVPYVGYEEASKLAKEAMTSNKTIQELIADKGILTPEQIRIILSPQNMTEPAFRLVT
jgi:aspartate ammonia-lyase